MPLQDPSHTEIKSRSKDGCSVVQKSVIFYRVSQNDTLLDIMCESGYSNNDNECGESGINLQFRIPISPIETGKKYFITWCYMLMFPNNQCANFLVFLLDCFAFFQQKQTKSSTFRFSLLWHFPDFDITSIMTHTQLWNGAQGGCDRSTGNAYFS